MYITNLKYEILRTLRNSLNEKPEGQITAKFGLGFCDRAAVLVSIWGTMLTKTGFVFIKTFPFLLVWVLALLVSELDFR